MKIVKVKESAVKLDKSTWDELVNRGDILEDIKNYMWIAASEAFDDQGRPARSWNPRFSPNFAGIVNRLNAGHNPRPQDFEPKPALHDTGRLKNSLQGRVSGNTAEVGTTVHYATRMQEGGPSLITLTSDGKDRLAKWLRKNRTNRFYQESLGWLFGKPSFTVNVQARPFLMITDGDLEEFEKIVASHIESAA